MSTPEEIHRSPDPAPCHRNRFVNELIVTESRTAYGRAFTFFRNMDIGYNNTVRPRKNWSRQAWHTENFRQPPKYMNQTPTLRIDDFHKSIDRNNDPIAKKSTKKKVCRKIIKAFDSYCDKSTLHGLKYVGDEDISTTERLFWLAAFLSAVGFAIYFITSLYTKFNDNPVIISFSPTPVTLDTIPFPAITICNVNIATKKSAKRIQKYGTEVSRRLLSDMCNFNNSFTNDTTDEATGDWRTVRSFIISVNQRCEDMFKVCRWENLEVNCSSYINSILTDEGYCCSFNRLPSNYSLRETNDDLNETYLENQVDWNPEDGYPSTVGEGSLPLRSFGAGAHLGLTLVLDANLDEYYCSSTSSSGFKALLSSPIDSPKVAEYGFLIPTGDETRVTIQPLIVDATHSIQSIDIKKRQCFFARERYLQFFRIYSERSCKLECQANFTLMRCHCVPYFLPKNMNTKICDKKQQDCVNQAKYQIERYTDERRECNCLPSCFDINYTIKSYSLGKMDNSTVSDALRKNISYDYFMENMAVVHFFFAEDKFTKQTKSELYGFSEFLSNTGGLLGLFLGFSFLSAVEIFYFIFLKASCGFYKANERKKRGATTATQIATLPFLD